MLAELKEAFMFESLVNTEGFKTEEVRTNEHQTFESLVNTEGFKTTQ